VAVRRSYSLKIAAKPSTTQTNKNLFNQ